MTVHDPIPATDISQKEFVLATDLDGTFLGGPPEDRANFYGWIEGNRHRVGLIFVTGRDPGFIRDLTMKQGVPRPDYVVGDVGTTIAMVDEGHYLNPITALEDEIDAAWGDASGRVQASLHSVAGLSLQSTGFRYRVSYDLDPETFDAAALAIVEDLGLDALMSDNRFLDVLPKGVSKGPSLVRLLAHLGVAHERTLVAGDTLNDLSMLELGLPAVAVGGSEAALLEAVASLAHVHKAQAVGVAGIAEAILSHKLFQTR